MSADDQDRPPADLAAIDEAAAGWVACRDRGLTPAQQDQFFQWLAADPRHGERFARHQRGWNQLAHLAEWRPEHGAEPNPDLLAPPAPPAARPPSRKKRGWLAPVALAMAAAVAVVFVSNRPSASISVGGGTAEPGYRQQVLDDGSVAELNRGASLSVDFTAAERRVRIVHGEASFTVTKNPARPFVVEAGGVTVRAVGTVFNVRLGAAAVEVLVTEGSVQVDRPAAPFAAPPMVASGERTVVARAGGSPVTTAVTSAEIDHALAWQPRLMKFEATPLAEVAVEFNRHNRVQLVVADETLRALPIGASFRSDNVDGFVRLLEASFGIRAERTPDTIVLRRAR